MGQSRSSDQVALLKKDRINTRLATRKDVDALTKLEDICFDGDRISRRSFKHFLEKGNCSLVVATRQTAVPGETEIIVGYALTLYHRGTELARLYSLAVLPDQRGGGIARILMQESEKLAREKGCVSIRLEVRPDNVAAIQFYESIEFRLFAKHLDYYEDHADALRYEKRIIKRHTKPIVDVPYYQQTTDFTCGPASLMMAMKAFDPDVVMGRSLEYQLWREATTIHMTSGHGGCSAQGLALAAAKRGYRVELYVSHREAFFLDGVRDPKKKVVMQVVHDDFMIQLHDHHVTIHYEELTVGTLDTILQNGGVPILLISCYRFTREKTPHWVVVNHNEPSFFYIHDPDDPDEYEKNSTDQMNIPVSRSAFERISRFGKQKQRAAVIIYRS
jgi:ribosomal protein S18 acetylase RimI-like enzyme